MTVEPYLEWHSRCGGTVDEYQEYARNSVRRHFHAEPKPEPERRYTREEVLHAFGTAANMVQDTHEYEDEDTIAADAELDLAVTVADYLLDHPGATLDEIIITQYSELDLDADDFPEPADPTGAPPLPKKGSPEWNAALVDKIMSWLP